MKCDVCGIRDAILFVQRISNSASVELHLCSECAKQRGVTGLEKDAEEKVEKKLEISLGPLLAGLLSADALLNAQKYVCPGCNQNLADLRKYKTIGCSECYTFFRSEIISLLRKEDIELSYTGELPKKLIHFRSRLTDRTSLQTKLQKAIESEDYESAALYRDRLKVFDSPAINFEDTVHG